MKQPKSLVELARIAINKSIISRPHLRELALPPRLIREAEEQFLGDRINGDKSLRALFAAAYRVTY